MKRSFLYGAFLCLMASISWGAMFPVAHHAFQYIDPFYFTILRYVPVAIILVVMLWMKEGKKALKQKEKDFPWFYGTMAFTVYNLFIFRGQNALGTSGTLLASIMESLMPMISVLIMSFCKANAQTFTRSAVYLSLLSVSSLSLQKEIFQAYYR